jgi:hypothetical protein
MSYLYTGTSQGAATATGLSTQILIQVDGQGIGAIQSLRVSERRQNRRITEVGTDGVIEIVPNQAAEVSLSVDRIVFDRKTLTEAFQRAFLHIHSQRIPFDIFVYDFSSAVSDTSLDANPSELDIGSAFDAPANAEGVITTVYENCWFSSLEGTYAGNDYIISQSAQIDCEFVRSFKDGKQNVPASRGEPALFDALEALADMGRRGSLDARGLARISDTFSNLLNP